MANRPTRPRGLTADERTKAKTETRAYRTRMGLSVKDLCTLVGCSEATISSWESLTNEAGGPTEEYAKTVDQLIGKSGIDDFEVGDFCDLWKWTEAAQELRELNGEPVDRRLEVSEFLAILRRTGFNVSEVAVARGEPRLLFWVHTLREPGLVHGVFALAAAAATRAGLTVQLLLDDSRPEPGSPSVEVRERFMRRVHQWFAFGYGDPTLLLDVRLYSSVLGPVEGRAEFGWKAFEAYFNADSSMIDHLLAAKAISPILFDESPAEAVGELLARDSARSALVKHMLMNLMVFETGISELRRSMSDVEGDRPDAEEALPAVLTLGGEDERKLWEVWARGAGPAADGVQHLYLQPMRLDKGTTLWTRNALKANSTSADSLAAFMRSSSAKLKPWFARVCVGLPAALNPEYADSLEATLTDWLATDAQPATKLSPARIAKAVAQWLL